MRLESVRGLGGLTAACARTDTRSVVDINDRYARAKALLAGAISARERSERHVAASEARLEELGQHEELARIHQDHELLMQIGGLKREIEDSLIAARANLAEAASMEEEVREAIDELRALARSSGHAIDLSVPDTSAQDRALGNVRDAIRDLESVASFGSEAPAARSRSDEAAKPTWEDPKVVLERLKAERAGKATQDASPAGPGEKKPFKKRTL